MQIPVTLERVEKPGQDEWTLLEIERKARQFSLNTGKDLPTLDQLLYDTEDDETPTVTEFLQGEE